MVKLKILSKKSSSNKNHFALKNHLALKNPFDEVKVISFSFSSKNRDSTAFSQYNLLLKPEILQAHIDFDSKRGKLVCITAFDAEKELFASGLNPKMHSLEWISYKEYKLRNVSCGL